MNSALLNTKWSQLPEKIVRRLQAEKLTRYLRDVVLPFSAHYRARFEKAGLTADSFRSLEDLRKLPFTTKTDLLNTPDNPQRTRDFVLIPDQAVLARRPSIIFDALISGREHVKQKFEAEVRQIMLRV